MASLHRRSRSPYWHAAFTARRSPRHRSTGNSDRGAALRLALRWEDASKAARAKTFTAAQAHKILRECVALSTGEPLQTFTCRQWLEEWLAGNTTYTNSINGRTSHYKAGDFDAIIPQLCYKQISQPGTTILFIKHPVTNDKMVCAHCEVPSCPSRLRPFVNKAITSPI